MEKFKRKLYRLEYKYSRFAIPNLMAYVTLTMLAVYILHFLLGVPVINYMSLSRDMIFKGQVWRLVSFLFIPPITSVIWMLFALYFYYFIGRDLESHWGSFKFNIYFLCGAVGIILAGLITGYGDAQYLYLSLFLAYAYLFPDIQFLLFFILPVKAKYLGFFDALLLLISFISGGISTKISIVFSLLNFLLFFGGDIFSGIKNNLKYAKNRRNFNNSMNKNRF